LMRASVATVGVIVLALLVGERSKSGRVKT